MKVKLLVYTDHEATRYPLPRYVAIKFIVRGYELDRNFEVKVTENRRRVLELFIIKEIPLYYSKRYTWRALVSMINSTPLRDVWSDLFFSTSELSIKNLEKTYTIDSEALEILGIPAETIIENLIVSSEEKVVNAIWCRYGRK